MTIKSNVLKVDKDSKQFDYKMYPGMDTASNYSADNPKKNSEAHKTSGYFISQNKFYAK